MIKELDHQDLSLIQACLLNACKYLSAAMDYRVRGLKSLEESNIRRTRELLDDVVSQFIEKGEDENEDN